MLALELSSQDISADRSDDVLKGINTLIEKTDEIILRDLRSANKGLIDIVATKAYGSATLSDIKTFYRKNIGLTPAGQTGGRPNTEIISYSYMGLYIIAGMFLSRIALHRLRNRASAADYAKASGIRAAQGVILLASLLGSAIFKNNQPAWRVREIENEIPKKNSSQRKTD